MSNLCSQCRIILRTNSFNYINDASKFNNDDIKKSVCNWCKNKLI